MSFLAPWLLWGLGLASAPIIIHLLNRRRFLRVDWAPMKYLKLTLKANRRRLRIEHWILLAVRTLAVAALVFAIARPMSSTASLAGFLKLNSRASRVIVLDDSLSMQHAGTQGSTFERGRQAAVEVLRELGAQDSLTVCTSTQPEATLVRHVQLENPASLIGRVQQLTPSDVASDWTTTFAVVEEHLSGAALPMKEVILITDLWTHGWSAELTNRADRWAEEGVSLRILDVGREPEGNRRLLSLIQHTSVALVDAEIELRAQVRNEAAETLVSEQALLSVDDDIQSIVLPDIPAGETAELPITLTFDEPGLHRVSLQLPQDALPGDNIRQLIVDVRRHVDVALVDGEPGLQPFESETDFLGLALTAGNSQWKAAPVIASDWAAQPLEAPDVLILANVESVSRERAGEIEELVQAGMGLIIFAGEQLDAAEYNETLFRDGAGLLPGRIEQSRELESSGLAIEPLADSPLIPLAKLSADALSRIRPRRILEVSIPEDAAASINVLARWNDARQSPALLARRFGQGRVLFWTVSADRDGSDWPTEASFVLAARLAAESVAARVLRWENLYCGQPLRFPLDATALPQGVSLIRAEGEVRSEAVVDPAGAEGPEFRQSSVRLSGHYRADWDEPGVGAKSRWFAVSPDVRDSTPQRLTTDALQQHLGRLTPKLLRFSGEGLDLATEGTEWWRTMVGIVAGLLLFESLFAAWVGRMK